MQIVMRRNHGFEPHQRAWTRNALHCKRHKRSTSPSNSVARELEETAQETPFCHIPQFLAAVIGAQFENQGSAGL